MKKQKCPSCAKKIEKDFNYCPWCGAGIKNIQKKDNYGMLGTDDNVNGNMFSKEIKLPFGMDKMVSSLMKQLEKEMGNAGKDINDMPKGFNIKIHTGKPVHMNKVVNQNNIVKAPVVSDEERIRRSKLPRKEAISKIKRLAGRLIYEIETPGIKDNSQVAIAKLEKGFEIRSFTKNCCYIKNIPLNMQLMNVKIKKDLVLIEFKN